MAEALHKHGGQFEVSTVRGTGFGPRYEVEGGLLCPDGRLPQIRTVWQIDKGSVEPRLNLSPLRKPSRSNAGWPKWVMFMIVF